MPHKYRHTGPTEGQRIRVGAFAWCPFPPFLLRAFLCDVSESSHQTELPCRGVCVTLTLSPSRAFRFSFLPDAAAALSSLAQHLSASTRAPGRAIALTFLISSSLELSLHDTLRAYKGMACTRRTRMKEANAQDACTNAWRGLKLSLGWKGKGDWHYVLIEVAFINAYDVDVNDHLCLETQVLPNGSPRRKLLGRPQE